MDIQDTKRAGAVQDKLAKRPYRSPTLVAFGRVSLLTQGSACSASNDGITCPAAGGSSMGMAASDLRLKENIVLVGKHPLGIGLYLFDYKPAFREECGHGRQFGVMAQEAAAVMPEAVSLRPDGYMKVDYAMLGIARAAH